MEWFKDVSARDGIGAQHWQYLAGAPPI